MAGLCRGLQPVAAALRCRVPRYTLYLLQDEASPTILRQVPLWQGRRIVPLPPDEAGGHEHVLAVAPAHVPRERVLEEPAAIIMRLQSDYMLKEWTRRLRHSAAQMRSVANWNRNNEARSIFVTSCACDAAADFLTA